MTVVAPEAPAAAPVADNRLISAKRLGKVYHLYERPLDRLKAQLLGRSFGREFWALRDVSFELRRGQTLGIIGRNGSGKSTLLQILANILQPTTGSLTVNGRVAALLELGSGFNPEYTGRENVYMNAAILGVGREDMRRRFDAVAEFAEIGEFLDQPVKTYSSGMFVRLAFSVAMNVDADLLLIDEALAVGDVFFRQKCYLRLEEMRRKGVSIILVSHSMSEVEQFCDECLLLHRGNVAFLGDSTEAVKHYYLLEQQERMPTMPAPAPAQAIDSAARDEFAWPDSSVFFDISALPQVGNAKAKCTALGITDEHGSPSQSFGQGSRAIVYFEFEMLEDIEVPVGGLVIFNDKSVMVHGRHTMQHGSPVPRFVPRGARLRFRREVKLDLDLGEYTIECGLAAMSQTDYDLRLKLSPEELDARYVRICHLPRAGRFSVTFSQGDGPRQATHYGVANLPGDCRVDVVPPPANTARPQDRLIVTEYPKCGGTWVVGLLGDALGWDKRDIYVKAEYAFEAAKHPWYANANSLDLTPRCVIKSHESPGSPLINFPADYVLLLRDGRDVAVSRYFYERDFSVKNGISKSFDTPFSQYLAQVAGEWRDYVCRWLKEPVTRVRYEDFIADCAGTVNRVLSRVGHRVAPEKIQAAVQNNTKEKTAKSLERAFQHNTFVRKGIVGDWRNHFSAEDIAMFKRIAGEALIETGYEKDLNW